MRADVRDSRGHSVSVQQVVPQPQVSRQHHAGAHAAGLNHMAHELDGKISEKVYAILSDEFQTDANKKVASKEVGEAKLKEKEVLREQRERELEAKQK